MFKRLNKMMTKEDILATGDWYEADSINQMHGFFWRHKSIADDGYVFYMKFFSNDGFTCIEEKGRDENKLFEGYLKTPSDLEDIVRLCCLDEI
jgi:hypothetical protein